MGLNLVMRYHILELCYVITFFSTNVFPRIEVKRTITMFCIKDNTSSSLTLIEYMDSEIPTLSYGSFLLLMFLKSHKRLLLIHRRDSLPRETNV